MNGNNYRFLIVAGEASGDLHGGELVRALTEANPGSRFCGLGGKNMREAGVETLYDIDRMGTVGLMEFLGDLFHYLTVYRRLTTEIKSGRYDAVILIDYPTLNLRLARVSSRFQCPVFFFVSPQIWAWRRGRIKHIRKTINKMFVVLPFEEKMYAEEGVDAEFQGHPFVEVVKPGRSKEQAMHDWEMDADKPVVGLLPGSRNNEIQALLDVMLDSAKAIRQKIPECQFLLPVADSINPDDLKARLGSNPLNIRLVVGKTYDVMNICDFLIIASGSATLEAGLLGCPMVIIYKLKPFTYWLARKLVKTDFIGLVNIVAGERVVPELIQHDVTVENITREALAVLEHPQRQQEIRSRLLKVRHSLGEPGVMKRIASSIASYLQARNSHEKISV